MANVHQLGVFLAVAENLSFTRAAERLFLTQSAVSHQVAKLEQEVDCALFEREGRSVSLTPAGRVLVQHARRVVLAMEEATGAVRQAARPGSGRLRVGASATACQYILPEALRQFREQFPQYSLSVTPGDSGQVVEDLLGGQIDLGLLIKGERRRKLDYHELFADELQFLVSPLHPWAVAGRADRRQLGEQHMVLYARNSVTFRLVERYFLKMRVPLRDWIELGDMGAIKALVRLGLGVSVTAEWAARPELADQSLVLLPLPGGRLRRSWAVASAAGRKLSAAEQAFIQFCKTATAQLLLPIVAG